MDTAVPIQPVRIADHSGAPTATLDEVDIRSELVSRPHRPPNYESEDRALAVLAKEMAENPRNMLQKLVEIALGLCNADTAGISLLEGDVFRWEALAGVFASYRNSTMPRAASPCGVCIDQNATQLMHLADRCFPALRTEPRFVEALLIPFHDHGQPIGTVWIVTHKFDRKFDREDERVIRLLGQFASAGWQLWKASAAAAEASQRKDEFLALLGHELRNPLAAIRSATTVLEKLVATQSDVRPAVEVVARQSEHLSRIVDDMLDLSRLRRGELKLQTKPVELQAVVAGAVEATRPQIERRHHKLTVEIPPVPIRLQADPVRLAQLLANLLDNAAKYTPDGGQIWLTADVTDVEVRITVRDTGVGIPVEQLRSIFDLFTQLGGSLERSSGGLGLGLALVRSLAEMHGGSVEAASEGPGKGSRFTVRLPLVPAFAETVPPRESTAPTSRRILLVEDNADVAESLATVLSLDGHTVKIAHDGPVALGAVQAFAPDVVLLDMGLPGMSGYEVARRMREDTGKADLVIIGVSGYGDEEHRRFAQQAGCDLYLVKPVDDDALRAELGRAARSPS